MTRRENRRGRRRPYRDEISRVFVACGGETEAQYFRKVKGYYRNPAVRISVGSGDADPCGLIRYASKMRDREGFDEVWCVTDVDEFRFGDVTALARRSDVFLAISNPCFEYWLLLHHVDCIAPLANYDDVRRRLKKHVPQYKKNCLDFAAFADGVDDAIGRGKKRCPNIGAAHHINPSSGVWSLVERLRVR